MAGLTQADIAILQHYVDRGERLAYWGYLDAVTLRETGRHSSYAALAAQVAQSSIFDGVVADRYAAAVAAEMKIAMTPDDWDLLGLNLIMADLKFRRSYLDGGNGLVPDPAKAPRIAVDKVNESHATASFNTTGPVANDWGWDGTSGRLRISEVLEATSGTVSLTQGGDLLFTPDAAYSGAMSFTLESFRSEHAANDGNWSLHT